MARIRALIWPACLMLLASNVHARELEWQTLGLVDLRLASTSDETGWLEDGFGKVRYGAGRNEPVARIPEAALLIMPKYGWDLSGLLYLKADADQDQLVDLVEGFVAWKPVSTTPNRIRVKGGIFYPPISLENTGPAWTSPYSITPSAINAWVGEETRGYGVESSIIHSTGEHDFRYTGGILWGTDKAGTVLYRRGWALHDYKPSIGDKLPVPIPPGGGFLESRSSSMIEIDERPGYYAGFEWHDIERHHARVLYYDNQADPSAVEDNEQGWLTRFTAAGLQWPLDPRSELLAQYMTGYTLIDIPGLFVLRTDFDAAYVLLSRTYGRYRLTTRADWFEMEDVDGFSFDFSEDGHALLLAGSLQIDRTQAITLELQHIRSRRPTRATASRGPDWDEQVLSLNYRVLLR